MAQPPGKKLKTGEEAPDLPESEKDAPPDKTPKIKGSIAFHPEDTTMNCMPASIGNILVPLTDGGLQYLLAGARANVGVKSGRYMFEVKVLENMNPAEDPNSRHKTPQPRNQLRVGFAAAGASLFLGEAEQSAVSFDTEGFLARAGKKEPVAQRFTAGDVLAVVLNLDAGSPNANTVSLFKNGKRACHPQALPEPLKGQPLFPAVTFKNVTLSYNFGPLPLKALPFACRMITDAAAKDALVSPPAEKSKDGKNEVVFPSVLPDEGGWDWLDFFLEKNKSYTELSDRAILAWAEKSGLSRPLGYSARSSNDRPEMGFGVSIMDDGSIKRVLNAVAPTQERNYVVMEVKANLLKEERRESLARWANSGFRRVAAVVVGEPPAPQKKRCHDLLLKAKQEVVTAEWKAKKAEEKKKRLLEKRQRQLERERKKALKEAEREARKRQRELKRKADAEAAAAAKEGEQAGEEKPEEKAPEEAPPEAEEPEEEEEEEKEEEEPPEPPEGEPPKAELTAEEKRQSFRKLPSPDLSMYSLNASFAKFTLPDKDEGFDEIRQEWSKGDKCKEYLKQWVRERKSSTRVEDLMPGDWFNSKWKEWQKTVQAWRSKQNSFKAAEQIKQQAAAAKAAEKEAKRKAAVIAAEKAALEAKMKEAAEKAAEGQEGEKKEEAKEEEKKEEKKEEEKKEEPKEEEEEEPAVNFDDLDVFGVEDVLDVGGGQPLFSNFGFEDWTMMGLRYELHLLVHAFRKDVNDSERVGIHLDHLEFYYSKYFKKNINLKFYGVENAKELLELIRDTVVVSGKSQVVEPLLPDDMESLGLFSMLTEESRRNRALRIDLGEESAKLKLSQPGVAAPAGSGTVIRPGGPGAPGARGPQAVPGTTRPPVAAGAQGWGARAAGPAGFSGLRPAAMGAGGGGYRPAGPYTPARAFGAAAWKGYGKG